MRTVAKLNPERDFFSFLSKRRKYAYVFSSFSLEQEHFTHGLYMTALICLSDVKIEPIMFYEGINAKTFRRSIAFAVAVVVTSRSSPSTIPYQYMQCMQARREMCLIL